METPPEARGIRSGVMDIPTQIQKYIRDITGKSNGPGLIFHVPPDNFARGRKPWEAAYSNSSARFQNTFLTPFSPPFF